MPNEFIARNGVIALANSSISGSLTVSAGITGSFSGSLVGSASFATTANSASYALTASYVSGSSGSSISASYALSASFATNAVSASFFSGSISNAAFATSASFAATASFALNAGSGGGGTVGGQALLTQSIAATTWSFNHNLGTTYPVITVYDGPTNAVIQPLNIIPSGSNDINIFFSSPKTGYATAVAGGGYFVTNNGTTRKLVQSTPAVTWSFQHNIGDQYPAFEIYDNNNNIIIPSNIRAVDAYTAEITFAYSASGTAVATLGGGIGVGDVITVTSASSTWSLTHNLNTTYPIVTIWESGSNQIIQPDTITSVNANTILVTFTTPVKGYANISRAGSVISGSSDWNLIINKPNVGVVYSQSLAASTWSINHNLGAQWPLVTVYDNTNAVVIPQTIVSNDANNLTITFPSPQSGYANISRAGNYISGSILWSNITNGPFSTTGSVTNFTGSALQINGQNFTAGTLFGVANQGSESISFAPAVSASIGRILFFNNAAGTYTTARLTANNFEFQGPSNNTLMYISGSNRITISGSVFVSGSLTVSGSGTLNNIGPANFTGSLFVTGSSIFTGPVTASGVLVNPSGPGFITIGASGSYGSISSGGSGATLYMNGSARGGTTTAASNTVVFGTDGNFYISDSTTNTHKMFVSASGIIGIGTASSTEGTQPAGTISIIPNSSVSSGPLIQFAANGRIRPASTGDRLSIDGNALFLNSVFGGNIIMATGGGNVGIGTASPGYKLEVTSSASSAIFGASSTFAWTSGYLDHSAFLAPNMTGGALSVAFGKSASNYNVGKFVFNYIGNNSTSNSIGLGFYNADNLLIVRADGVIQVGGTNARNALQSSYFGYNGVYRTLIIGSSSTDYTTGGVSLAFNVDVSSNVNGSFTGNGSEYIWRNTATFITPNASNNGYNNLFGWNSSGQITFYNNFALNDQQLRTRYNSDANHALAHNTTTDGPFLYGYIGTALGYTSVGSATRVIWTNTTNAYNYNNSTSWQTTSDIRIKQNIRPINEALNKICSLNPSHFEFKNKPGITKTGFIAQEFEEVFPGHVTELEHLGEYTEYFEEGEKIKSIDADLIPYLVKAIQELTQRVKELENK